jgi:crotonobetainyl-CoA:carnitine CoA-transferase CaiB-like acyl-CoA transferase
MTPGSYACVLLGELGMKAAQLATSDTREESLLWAASGAQYLTGEAHGAPMPSPAPLATCAQGAWLALAATSRAALDPAFPAYQLLGERAATLGLQRRGAISAGGACRLLDCADGQLALNLPRGDDWQLLPAWLEGQADCWDAVMQALRDRSCAAMVSRARLLGLAAAHSAAPTAQRDWFKAARLAPAVKPSRRQPLVVDLSALWAGPLCTQLLGQMGARVIKVESTGRPDGARAGSPQFFDLLNTNKQSVALNLASAGGRRQLDALLACADIVIESARPRALEHMGMQAADIVRTGTGRVWLSITGYGRDAPMRDWIAFGDDAGVAAGLSWLLRKSSGSNVFCGDAIADPLTGLHAALLAWVAWTQGGGVLLDVSLYGVLAHCIAAGGATGQPAPLPGRAEVLPPRARPASGSAAALGSHTSEVLLEFGIG